MALSMRPLATISLHGAGDCGFCPHCRTRADKNVMVKIDDKMAMAVLPASYKVSFDLLKKAAGASKVELAHEQEFRDMLPELEVGAMPPFGNLYGMEVFVDESLSEDDEIAFNDGSHTELMKLSYRDFERLVKPKAARFAAR